MLTVSSPRRYSLSAQVSITAGLILLMGGLISPSTAFAAPPQPPTSAAAAKAKSAAAPPPSLDSMTRDGSDSGASALSASPDGQAGTGQSMNVGGAIARSIVSLGLVLALIVGAIKYLKRKGYGAGATDDALPASKPAFGVSPVAQMLLAVSSKSNVSKPISAAASPKSDIEDFQVLAAQPLPGSNHTLYKVRIGERVLLLGGNPTGGLSVLTEWDSETPTVIPQQGFDTLLAGAMDNRPLQTADRLQGAADRLTAAIRRAGAQSDPSATNWEGTA